MTLLIGALVVGVRSCSPSSPRQTLGSSSASAPAADLSEVTAHTASRCGECHSSQHARWAESGHARSDSAPLYLAMRTEAGGATCDRCHAPLKALIDPSEPAASEGVTCEVCHAISDVREVGGRMEVDLDLRDNKKRGPLCDGKDNYFHKMGCSPIHKESRLCAACHQASPELAVAATGADHGVPVFTDFDEWRTSSYAASGITCQDCHMPGGVEAIASGSQRQAHVGDHGFMGDGGDLRRRALSMKLTVEDRKGKLFAAVALRNEAGGHAVPTGLPGRQIVLRVHVRDEKGREELSETRVYGRVLVDKSGAEAPFYAAAREASDNRIGPGEAREEAFTFNPKGGGELSVEVVWRGISPAIAKQLEIKPDEIVIAEARVPFGAPRAGVGRAMLPRTALVKP